ncbi:MAG: hypothetical protein QQW96_08405 [Tychonema bourrellyi B0820]|nr:hypothetical protein [Tychonema bourrellyi]MDQ2097653.1 hypothetical protein [Tychonema bourrellyi B0820]
MGIGNWELGMGHWGLGIGDWGLALIQRQNKMLKGDRTDDRPLFAFNINF